MIRSLGWIAPVAVLGRLTAAGCSDDGQTKEPPGQASSAGSPPDSEGGGRSAEEGTPSSAPRYVIASAVTDDTGSSTYVKLMSGIESELDLSTARELAGWSDLALAGPYVLVSLTLR